MLGRQLHAPNCRPPVAWARPGFLGRPWARPSRRASGVAFGRRPKVPVEEASGAEQQQARPLPLHTDRYELPPPANTGGQAALADDLAILQQQEAAQQAAGSSGAAPGSGRRRCRQRRSEDGTSGAAAADPGASFDEELASEGDISAREEDGEGSGSEGEEEGDSPSELVFRLERRGEGWGEEIFPHIVVEKRPMQLTKSKHKCQHPDPWEEGSLEYYLIEVGVPPNDVDRVVEQAVAWRFTPGGRALIDRRRRSRVERNVRLVVQHLEMEGGIPFGPRGIGAILARVPEIMLCKPTTNDRWDRRAVELVAYQHQHGHCNVPEDWPANPELGAWVKRQRVARAAGQLSDDRMAILQGLGFEFGEVAQMTDEWEHRFDQLIDWMLWHKENQQRFSWLGIDWGQRGGITARELALWVRLQGEFRRRNLLPAEAIKRFEAIGVDWDVEDGTPTEREWMAQFSRLLYVIERHNTVTRPYLLQTARLGRPKAGTPGSGGGSPLANGSSEEEEEEEGVGGGGEEEVLHRTSSSAAHRGRAKLQQELAARRRALAVADLRCEAGLRYWLARQRWLWRQGRLAAEQVLMLQLAGVDMEGYTPAQWQAEAHAAAALLTRCEISLTPPPAQPADAAQQPAQPALQQQQRRQPQQQAQAPASLVPAAAARSRLSGRVSLSPPPPPPPPPPPQQQQQQPAGGGRPPVPASSLPSAVRGDGRPAAAPPAAGAATDGSEAASASAAGCLRLRVKRWIQTQAALFHDGHLSAAQLRYLTFLGITWVVSDEVMHMGDAAWNARFQQLVALCKAAAADGVPPAAAAAVADWDLREWLRHQRGLHALGLLREDRRKLLGALGLGWGHPRSEERRAWDARLSELLAFKAAHGHLDVQPKPSGCPPYPRLGPWVARQRVLLAVEAALDPGRAAQLAAIGLTPLCWGEGHPMQQQ